MADLVCPMLSTYLAALRTRFMVTPVLHELELEKLAELEEELRIEPLERRGREIRDRRVCLCLINGLYEEHIHATVYISKPPESTERSPLKPHGPNWFPTLQEELSQIAEGYQVAAGEMGLLGIRRDDQLLEYDLLTRGCEMIETCSELASMVNDYLRATNATDANKRAVRTSELFSKVCAIGHVSSNVELNYARELLRCDGTGGPWAVPPRTAVVLPAYPLGREPATIVRGGGRT